MRREAKPFAPNRSRRTERKRNTKSYTSARSSSLKVNCAATRLVRPSSPDRLDKLCDRIFRIDELGESNTGIIIDFYKELCEQARRRGDRAQRVRPSPHFVKLSR